MRRAWARELELVLACVAGGGLLGLVTQQLAWWAAGSLALYVLRHVYELQRLSRWLLRERGGYPPDGRGVWREIYRRLSRVHRGHRFRRRQVRALLMRLQQSTRALPDALVLLKAGLHIEWASAAAGRMLGIYTPRDQGQRIENLLRHPSIGPFLRAREPDAVLMVRSPTRRGMRLELRTVAFGDRQQLLIARDATERERIDNMRRDFVANVSHELRTPLTVLSGYLENMQDDLEQLPERWHRPVRAMNEQAERMRRLVEDLLTLARVEASGSRAELTVVDVPAMVQALRHDGQDLAEERGHTITAQTDRSLHLRAVSNDLHTVFMNLLANAIQYTPAGGNIELRWFADGSDVCFEVRDDGDGIAAEHLPRLTERFYRVDGGRSRDVGGTGLGLAIVKHVLENHAATLEIESVEGQGSVFRCRFPAELIVRVEPALKVVNGRP